MKRDDKVTLAAVALLLVGSAIVLAPAQLVSAASWKSIVKAAIGPFLGAGLAFLSAMYIQARNRTRDNVCAGNLALLTLSAQYNDFLKARKTIRFDLARRIAGSGGAKVPLWLLAPSIGSHATLRMLDFESLSFLFDSKEGIDVFGPVVNAEQHYEALYATIGLMSKKSEEIQSAMAKILVPNAPRISEAELEVAVGMNLTHQTADLLRGVVAEIESESVYLDAFQRLRGALARLYEGKLIPKSIGPGPGSAEEDLPPLPASLTG